MLVPAILYKDEILKAFSRELYTEDYFLYNGYAHCNTLPEIRLENDVYQFAIVDTEEKLVGYLCYRVDVNASCVYNFGVYSFDRGNPIIGNDLFYELKRLLDIYHRIEWRMISGNPVQKHYDKFCEMFNGVSVVLHDVCKDPNGNYRNEHIYEVFGQEG